jgi:hypothetical protein
MIASAKSKIVLKYDAASRLMSQEERDLLLEIIEFLGMDVSTSSTKGDSVTEGEKDGQ